MATIEIKCKGCGAAHSYDCSNLNWEIVISNERSMGTESNHQAVIENKCSCGDSIMVTFNCWEYPAGVKETDEVELYGASMVKHDCSLCPDLQ